MRIPDYNLEPPDNYSDFSCFTDEELVSEITNMINVTDYDEECGIPRHKRLANENYLKDLLEEASQRGIDL